jgi:ribosomal-protein-alanine N-acetyltransferase
METGMQYAFKLMNEADAHTIQMWHYEGEYAIYNASADSDDGLSEMLEPRSPYYAVRDELGELVGFFCFGTAAQPWNNDNPGLHNEDRSIDIGLGLRPDLTGKGLGLAFVQAGLTFAKAQFAPVAYRLFVLTFNQRAIRVYEQAGFVHVRLFVRRNPLNEEMTFLEMRREV